MDWQSTYRIALSLIALLALAGAAWFFVAPEPSPGVEIIPAYAGGEQRRIAASDQRRGVAGRRGAVVGEP